jgi:outer membrane lipoprotein-sorting protein
MVGSASQPKKLNFMKKLGFYLVLLVSLLSSCTKDEPLKDATQENLNKLLGKWKEVSFTFQDPDSIDVYHVKYFVDSSYFEFKTNGTFIHRYAYKGINPIFNTINGQFVVSNDKMDLIYKSGLATYILSFDLQFLSDDKLNIKIKTPCESTSGYCEKSYYLEK